MSKPPNPLADPALKPKPGVNIRRARAGGFILQGKSLKQSLIAAGFAETTASNPTRAGLSAETCLAEAAKLDKRFDPGTLISGSRRLLKRTLDAWLAKSDDSLTDKTGAVAIPRLVETTERYHGNVSIVETSTDTRSFVDRVQLIAETLAEMRRRGMVRGHENEDSRDTGSDADVGPVKLIEARRKSEGTPLP